MILHSLSMEGMNLIGIASNFERFGWKKYGEDEDETDNMEED